ncbi:uncharacterized protein LOC131624444 [Vicia villosa]|uniref:uncharacterized protein LOC131624444 n=1 Tax=Vicia villosa TaxID=3911 RepID=UPI00273BB809|nr:uncharacterized protein LOC131624444 [Vicia villosa]
MIPNAQNPFLVSRRMGHIEKRETHQIIPATNRFYSLSTVHRLSLYHFTLPLLERETKHRRSDMATPESNLDPNPFLEEQPWILLIFLQTGQPVDTDLDSLYSRCSFFDAFADFVRYVSSLPHSRNGLLNPSDEVAFAIAWFFSFLSRKRKSVLTLTEGGGDAQRFAIGDKVPETFLKRTCVLAQRGNLPHFSGPSPVVPVNNLGGLKSQTSSTKLADHKELISLLQNFMQCATSSSMKLLSKTLEPCFTAPIANVLKGEIDNNELRWYAYCMFKSLACLHKQVIFPICN